MLVKGLPGEPDLLRGALIERVNADMALGKTSEAVQELTKLLENAKGDEGIALVSQLLDQLDKEFARASLAKDTATMRVTAKNEALLTRYLVDWSDPQKQTKPNISKLYYAYAVYDARTQRLAGSLAEDPAERQKLLEGASKQYRFLQSRPMHDLYIADPKVKKQIAKGDIEVTDLDPSVATGLALTDFDLGNYQSARDQLEPMIAQKKFGTPRVEVLDPRSGEMKVIDNDLYWETQYKFVKSEYEVSKNTPTALARCVKILKNVLIFGGIPERYQDDFEALRKQIAPDFNPNGPATAVQPATQPTSPAASAAAVVGQK